ncbi:hypothetical protein RHSIM_Rhsim02G0115300 [Rhododendron simsii]|uniref:Uncharacterized protein n=1 Tax=Rhododendron simsii TaxID=118357 RepID=A0A834H9I9_RHOSS|nr:hypothetical protein RHSIM_Rhsim02G0115300 [Rhododendron simsii]
MSKTKQLFDKEDEIAIPKGNGVGNGRAKVSGSRTGDAGSWKGGEKSEVERMGVDAEIEELVSDSKNVELEGKWKKLRVEEMELYLKRVGLIREQAKVVLGAMKSQGD